MKRAGFLNKYIFHNFFMKLISLAIAVLFWILVAGRTN
jgi:hypothetical protein